MLIASIVFTLSGCGTFKDSAHESITESSSYKTPVTPKSIDELIAFTVPQEFNLEMEYPFDGEDGNPVVQVAYSSEEGGYFSAGIFSFKGWDCLGDINNKISLKDNLKYLDGITKIETAGETGYFGTCESDDMPRMVAVFYLEHGEYIFEFRLTNGDEQITDEQINGFKQILSLVEFKY
ncbi:MAG: hypothetical protein J6T73_07340 [Clostridia bacterium]|nr:hypothetical protein [Clostridia bacterium]